MYFVCTEEHYKSVIMPKIKADLKPETYVNNIPAIVRGSDGKIEGVISVKGTLGAWYGTLYSDITSQIKELEKNGRVERIILDINSPGGFVDGVIETARAIAECKKEVIAKVGFMAASGAYWLASQCDKIIATTNIATFGSIGVIISYLDFKEYFAKEGIKEIVITSTNAPNKYTDPATDEGHSEILAYLNKIHNEFAETVAKGRGVSIDKVNSDFGKGGILFAEDALKVGMIDLIISKEEKMPETYTNEELQSKVSEAVAKERAEISKHIDFIGRAKNETIIANIKDGKKFEDCVANYFEEEYAAKALSEKIESNPIETHSPGDKGEEKKTDEEIKKEEYLKNLKAEAKKLGIEV